MASKVEVRITYCCCCSLTVATILIGIYTIITYGVFTGLAARSIARLTAGLPDPGEAGPNDEVGSIQTADGTRLVLVDPYHQSLGLYTEELVLDKNKVRLTALAVSIAIFIALILAAILLFVAICTGIPWLLTPWMGVMVLDIIRGIMLVVVIFVYSGGDIRKIAVGIFFLGLQFFHTSLILIIFAKLTRMLNKQNGIEYRVERTGDKSILVDGSNSYPTLPSQYAYSGSPHYRREAGYYQPGFKHSGSDLNAGQYYRPEAPGAGYGSSTLPRPTYVPPPGK